MHFATSVSHCTTVLMYVHCPTGELAHWFSSSQALSQPRYELEQLSELQGVLRRRESELAMKEDLLARKEEELVAMVAQLEEQSGRAQRLEHERSSEERRRCKLEQAEKDLVSWRHERCLGKCDGKKCYCESVVSGFTTSIDQFCWQLSGGWDSVAMICSTHISAVVHTLHSL